MTKTTLQLPKHLVLKRSATGLGIFATKDIYKDDFIIEYTGEKISHDESNRRGGMYLFTLNDDWVIDGSARHNGARYLNHSCNPNIEAIIEDDARIMFYALRDIAEGEELTFDYGEEYFNDIIAKKGCKCTKCSPSQ